MARKNLPERVFEGVLFFSRWLMAPFYFGLIAALVALLAVFFQDLWREFPVIWNNNHGMDTDQAIMLALSLIDLSLAGNLVLIVMFAGYENFVSKIDTGDHEDRPEWMGTVDFSDLKLKLVASIVAISGIALLKAFLEMSDGTEFTPDEQTRLMWQAIIHVAFVVTGVLLALMDWLTSHARNTHGAVAE
ncbi:MAG TPA: TIGR00645 family protein [Hyphomonadaceae bacterium]|nr:TIGR00645 family protein [Hyphomonadaceae bacterium]